MRYEYDQELIGQCLTFHARARVCAPVPVIFQKKGWKQVNFGPASNSMFY